MVKINGADGNMRQYKEALEGEDFVPEFNTLRQAANVPNLLRPLIRTLIDKRRGHLIGCASEWDTIIYYPVYHDYYPCAILSHSFLVLYFLENGGISAHAFGQLSCDLMEMRASWEQAFMDAGIDAIIHPALPIPALPHGMGCDITSAFSYTLLANMLLWPAGVLPVTTIQKDEQHYKMNDLPADQRDLYAKLAAQTMKNSAGLPVSVAIMTPNFRDETCLRVMKEIESLVQFSAEPQEYTR
jgi:fatty acid amide hydrolase